MRWIVAVAGVASAACGGEKAKPADSAPPASAPASATATPAPTGAPAADTVKPMKADTTGTKKAMGPERDSAFGPKAAIDEKGKVVPLKKPQRTEGRREKTAGK